MKRKTFVAGSAQENCYLIYDEEERTGVLIDPGDAPEAVIAWMEREMIRPLAMLLTHGHFDHIYGTKMIREHFGIPLLIAEEDAPMLHDPEKSFAMQFDGRDFTVDEDGFFTDGELLEFGENEDAPWFRARVIHTPGHSSGSSCFYLEGEGILFSGDTLFYRSVGRTDLGEGSMPLQLQSIRTKLYTLPEETTVYPGHGFPTRIRDEKLENPFTR